MKKFKYLQPRFILFLCFLGFHRWTDTEIGERWINSAIIVSDYIDYCDRCGVQIK